MKFKKLEEEIIDLRESNSNRDLMYKKVLEITENDLDNMDLCRKLLKVKDLDKLSATKKIQLLNKIKNIFGRKSPNCDNNSTLEDWIGYIIG